LLRYSAISSQLVAQIGKAVFGAGLRNAGALEANHLSASYKTPLSDPSSASVITTNPQPALQ
jgi:hypothetical protein